MTPSPSPQPTAPDLFHSELRSALLSRIGQGQLELPLLPQVAQEVLIETDSERGDARRLADILRRDPAMAGHALRIANSPLFLPTSPIVSLQQAISRLGMVSIRRIALLITCQTRVFCVSGYEDVVRRLFQHSLGTAAFAQEIARLRRSNVEEAFLCGLLHDVGRPVILQALSDMIKEAGGRAQAPEGRAQALAIERELHGQVGSLLSQRWGLPPGLCEAIAHHHEPACAKEHAAVVVTTAVADDLAHMVLGPREVDEAACRASPLWETLNLYPDQVEQIIGRRGAVIDLVRSLS